MPFLSISQQFQSTKGKTIVYLCLRGAAKNFVTSANTAISEKQQ